MPGIMEGGKPSFPGNEFSPSLDQQLINCMDYVRRTGGLQGVSTLRLTQLRDFNYISNEQFDTEIADRAIYYGLVLEIPNQLVLIPEP